MTESKSDAVKYFGFGTNKDLDMMIHMVGNPNLKGEHGKLIGYELCIQNINQIRDGIIPPFKKSPREIIKNGFGNSFKLYVIRPKDGKSVHGTIWNLTREEFERTRNWELVDFGMQEDAKGMAVDSKGKQVQVETQALLKEPREIESIIEGDNYDPYIAPREAMLKTADEVLKDYLKRKR